MNDQISRCIGEVSLRETARDEATIKRRGAHENGEVGKKKNFQTALFYFSPSCAPLPSTWRLALLVLLPEALLVPFNIILEAARDVSGSKILAKAAQLCAVFCTSHTGLLSAIVPHA